ncbi:O-antigen ligase family protein [Planctomycetota bacterium]
MLKSNISTVGGLSLTQIAGIFCVFGCVTRKFNFKLLRSPIVLLVFLIGLYQVGSYYSYFKNIELSILNNAFFCLIVICTIDTSDRNHFLQVCLTALFAGYLLLGTSMLTQINVLSNSYIININMDNQIFGNVRHIGFYGILTLPYVLALTWEIRNTKFINILFIPYILLCIAYNILSYSRLNILIFISIIILCMIKNMGSNVLPKKFVLLLIIVIILFLPTEMIISFLTKDTLQDISNVTKLNDPTLVHFTSGRSEIYLYGWEMFKDFPIFGAGYLRWSDSSNVGYNPFEGSNELYSMHNVHLQYLAEMGIVGLSMYWCLLFFLMILGLKWVNNKHYCECNNIRDVGTVVFLVAFIMFIGGMLDNYGLQSRHLFIATGFAVAFSQRYVLQ